MEENTNQSEVAEVTQSDIQDVNAQNEAYLEQRMQFAFSDDNQQQNLGQTTKQDEVVEDNLSQVEIITQEEAVTTVSEPVNPFVELGFNSKDELLAELNSLREAKPSAAQEAQYANEESKKVHQLLLEGKIKDVIEVYQKRELASNFESLNEEQKIKLHIKMENPLFDEDLINYHYNKNYVFDEDNFSGDEMELKMAKISAKQKSISAVKAAEETVSKYKEIQLPDISVPQTVTQNKDYEEQMASVAQAQEFTEKVIVPKTNSLKEEDLKMSFEINDPKAQMQFRVSVTPTKEHLEEAKKGVLNFSDFIRSVSYDEDGNYNPVKAAQFVLKNQHFDDYVKSVARQAVNAERKQRLASAPQGGGINKDFVVDNSMSEIDKMMAYRMSN